MAKYRVTETYTLEVEARNKGEAKEEFWSKMMDNEVAAATTEVTKIQVVLKKKPPKKKR